MIPVARRAEYESRGIDAFDVRAGFLLRQEAHLGLDRSRPEWLILLLPVSIPWHELTSGWPGRRHRVRVLP